MRLPRFSHLLLLLTLVVIGCRPTAAQSQNPVADSVRMTTVTLNVFAAASLTDAFQEIGLAFTQVNPGIEIIFNFAGSNQLATQIGEGAPADVFAAANSTQMQVALESGRIVSGTQQVFARNRLVIVAPGDNPAGLTTLQDLATPGIKVVLATAAVPVGEYALTFLDKAAADSGTGAGYKEAVIANVVSYEQNVRAVLTKVALGEADAGIVYTSDIGAAAAEVTQLAIPDNLNTIADYPVAPLADSPYLLQAQQFVDYLLSPAGQQVLVKYGFIPTTAKERNAAQ